MARTTFIEIPDPQKDQYWGGLNVGDRYTLARVIRKTAFLAVSKP